MADRDQTYPLAPSYQGRSDEESLQSGKHRRKRWIKCIGYSISFAVFQTIIVLVFALTVLRIKTPDIKLISISVESFQVDTAASPSFNIRLLAEVTVKNKNFGHFKYENSTAIVAYHGTTVGQTLIPNGRAKARRTRKMNITMDVSSDQGSGNSNLSSDLSSGTLTLTSYTKLSGKVKVMMLIKKRKTAELNCNMTFSVAGRSIQDLNCK